MVSTVDGKRVQAVVTRRFPEGFVITSTEGKLMRVRTIKLELERDSRFDPWRVADKKVSCTVTRPLENLPANSRAYSYVDLSLIDFDDVKNRELKDNVENMIHLVTQDSEHHL